MSERLTTLRCDEFVAQLGSDAPVPGGGSASGLVAALATALANMVGHLTVGKKKYAEVEEEIQTLMKRCDALEKEMLAMAEKDAEAFRPLSAAYRMPEDTPEQAEEKARVMEGVLAEATYAPLEIVRGCREVIEICDAFAHKGSRLAVSDAGVGVLFAKSAMQGAALNVFINTRSMKDRKQAADINRETEAILSVYGRKADEVYAYVRNQLR